jgi:hypothetical protein
MAYFADLFFGPVSRSFPDWIHANEDVSTRLILLVKPRLKGSARDCLGRENPLRRLLLPNAIPNENCCVVARLAEGIHVFKRGQESSRE